MPMGTHKGCRDTGTNTPREPIRTIVGASLVGALGGRGETPNGWRPFENSIGYPLTLALVVPLVHPRSGITGRWADLAR